MAEFVAKFGLELKRIPPKALVGRNSCSVKTQEKAARPQPPSTNRTNDQADAKECTDRDQSKEAKGQEGKKGPEGEKDSEANEYSPAAMRRSLSRRTWSKQGS